MDINPENDCDECEESCAAVKQTKRQNDEMMARLKSSEFAADILNHLAGHYGMKTEDCAAHLDEMMKQVQSLADATVADLVKDAVRSYVVRTMDGKITAMLNELFDKAMAEKLLAITSDGKALVTTVQERAANEIKAFIDSQAKGNKSWSDRDRVKETMDAVIARVVGKQVEEAIKEVKDEAIEKFNKEAMKQMLNGMAKSIGQDRRLLAVMGAVE